MAANVSLSRSEFRAMREAKSRAGKYLVVQTRKNSLNSLRLGMTVSRKFGKAHERNRAKRRIREAIRQICPEAGVDILVRPRQGIKLAPFEEIAKELADLI